jgi:hypothetical protein
MIYTKRVCDDMFFMLRRLITSHFYQLIEKNTGYATVENAGSQD